MESQLRLIKNHSSQKDTIGFSRMESQLRPAANLSDKFRRKLKLHAAKAGGVFLSASEYQISNSLSLTPPAAFAHDKPLCLTRPVKTRSERSSL